MSVGYKLMRDGQEDAVATMVKQLPKDLNLAAQPAITGEILRSWKGQVHVIVADNAGLLCGACLWFDFYSSWRGLKGCYVCDLFVMEHLRGKKIGQGLLKATARAAAKQGANYMRLDVTTLNKNPEAFYQKLGFITDTEDLTMFMEHDIFQSFSAEVK